MAISIKATLKCLLTGVTVLTMAISAYPMGGKPDKAQAFIGKEQSAKEPESSMTIQEMGQLFWPDSKATELQQEEALKGILGKRVTWEIAVAQVQRDNSGYLIQGQSNKDMIGTFCYVTPTNEAEKDAILKASMDTKLKISGIIQDMQMRHIVLRPAQVIIEGK